MSRINKKFYVISFIVLGAITFILIFAFVGMSNEAAYGLFVAPIFIMYVIALVFHYKVWKAIQDGRTIITPGKAIGYLYIPIFGVYWLFRTLYGFAQEHNAYVSRNQIETKKLPELLYFYQCVIIVVTSALLRFESTWSFIGMLLVYVNSLIIISKSADAVNSIYKSRESNSISDA